MVSKYYNDLLQKQISDQFQLMHLNHSKGEIFRFINWKDGLRQVSKQSLIGSFQALLWLAENFWNLFKLSASNMDTSLPYDITYHRLVLFLTGYFRWSLPVVASGSNFHFLRRKHNRRYIVGEFLLNDFRFWNEIQCFKRQAEFIANSGGSGMYSATDEEILHDKARLICDQFLSSQILPKEYGF